MQKLFNRKYLCKWSKNESNVDQNICCRNQNDVVFIRIGENPLKNTEISFMSSINLNRIKNRGREFSSEPKLLGASKSMPLDTRTPCHSQAQISAIVILQPDCLLRYTPCFLFVLNQN